MNKLKDRVKKGLHKWGLHFYSQPIKNYRKVHYHIANDRGGYEELYSEYQRKKCQFCNKRKDIEFSKTKRTTGYGL